MDSLARMFVEKHWTMVCLLLVLAGITLFPLVDAEELSTIVGKFRHACYLNVS